MAGVTAAALAVGTLLWTDAQDRDTAASAEHGAQEAGLPEDRAQEKAVRSGKRVEVTAARTETSTTYALPNRSFELVSHAAPVRARVDGRWRSIDTTLRRTEEGWAPVASTAPVVFSNGGRASETDQVSTGRSDLGTTSSAVLRRTTGASTTSRTATAEDPSRFTELVRLVTDGHELVLSWPGDVPEPVIEGSRALYRNILPETDLLLTARDGGFNHVLVVHTERAATSPELLSLPYRLTSDELVFRHDAKTDVVTAVDRDGDELAVSPTPSPGTRRAPWPSRRAATRNPTHSPTPRRHRRRTSHPVPAEHTTEISRSPPGRPRTPTIPRARSTRLPTGRRRRVRRPAHPYVKPRS